MKVILLTDVPKVGRKYEVKNVSDGYASNFLLPRKLAERATAAKLIQVTEFQKRTEESKEVELNLLEKNLASLKDVIVHLNARSNEQGHLYEGIHAPEIIEALTKEHRIDLNPEFLVMEHPLKNTGEHKIEVLAHNRKGTLNVVVGTL